MTNETRSTNIRYAVLLVTTLTSFMLYLDRVCISQIMVAPEFKAELQLTAEQNGWIKGIFFFAYALVQVPAGYLSDRFGARGAMTFYVAIWSIFTMLTGWASGFVTFLAVRLLFGIAQAGAYPTSVGLLRQWIPLAWRGFASSIVASGGRLGGALAPTLSNIVIITAGDWRAPLWLYGILGLLTAALFWIVFRQSPAEHPHCNAAECELITEGRPPQEATKTASHRLPWGPLLSNFSMWMNCLVQFCTNVGWAFLVTDLAEYLRSRDISPTLTGNLNTLVLLVGMIGMLQGGWVTDYCTRRWGVRWGRTMPVFVARLLSTVAYVVCLFTDDIYVIVAMMALVAYATDLGVGGIWAYTQDVGGKFTASILGWANMWGNLGAGLTPILVALIREHADPNGDWKEVFAVFAIAFLISTVAALGLDATKPIVPRESKTA